MKIRINSIKFVCLSIIAIFVFGSAIAQAPQSDNKQIVNTNITDTKKDTTAKQPANLGITKFINSLHPMTWSISASFGSDLFYGDMREYDFFPVSTKYVNDNVIPEVDDKVEAPWKVGKATGSPSERKWGGAFSINKQFNNSFFGMQVQYVFGQLGGVSYKTNSIIDKNHPENNVYKIPYHSDYFIANFHEFALNGTVSINKIFKRNAPSVPRLNVYVLGGIGLNTFKSSLRDLKTGVKENDEEHFNTPKNSEYRKYMIKEEKTTEVVFPVGFGLKYHLAPSSKWFVFFEYTLRNVNTDKMDNWSNPVTQRDKYQYTCLGLTYNFKKISDSLVSSKLKAKYDLQKKARESKSALETRLDSIEKVIGDLGHRLGSMETENKDVNDSLKIIEKRIIETIPQTGLNTMTFSPTDAVTQLLVVFFDFNKYDIKPQYHGNVALVARILKSDPKITLQIVGHADKVGSEKYNMELSKKRALAVANELKDAYGIDAARVSNIVIKGKSDPLSSKYDDVNRRVDFIFTKPVEPSKSK